MRTQRHLGPRLVVALFVAISLAVAVSGSAGADGPLPFVYLDSCPGMTLELVPYQGEVRLQTAEEAACTYVDFRGTATMPRTMYTTFFSERLVVEDFCSAGGSVTKGAQLQIDSQPNVPGAPIESFGQANFSFTGRQLTIDFVWDWQNAHVIGAAALELRTTGPCAVGSRFDGGFQVYDPDLSPTIEWLDEALSPLGLGDE